MVKTCKYGRARNSTRCRANYKKKTCRSGYLRAPPEYLCKKSKIYVPMYVRNRSKSVKPSVDAEQERVANVKATLAALRANTEAMKLQADLAKKKVADFMAKKKM